MVKIETLNNDKYLTIKAVQTLGELIAWVAAIRDI